MNIGYTFNINDALMCAKFSGRAYDAFEKDYLGFAMDLSSAGFKLVKTITDAETDTEGFLATNDEIAVLCFRGTYEVPMDVITDVAGKMINGGHEGIYKSFASVQEKIEEALDLVPDMPLFSTGHSLGGGLAKVSVLQLPHRNWKACYTFGSPPVCDADVASRNHIPIFRVVNEGDIVPRIMELEFVGDLGEFMVSAMSTVLKRKEIKIPAVVSAEEYVKSMKPDLKKYCHLGEVRYFNNDGLCPTLKNSLELFKGTVEKDWRRAIEDHKILRYISNIEKYIENRLVFEGHESLESEPEETC